MFGEPIKTVNFKSSINRSIHFHNLGEATSIFSEVSVDGSNRGLRQHHFRQLLRQLERDWRINIHHRSWAVDRGNTRYNVRVAMLQYYMTKYLSCFARQTLL
jgi:hypothetical protein